jgi:RIO-like serine/threonine protein kinase
MRMRKVPGKPVYEIKTKDFRPDAKSQFFHMIDQMTEAGIMHGDMHGRNVFYDTESGRFWPIDFTDIHDFYHQGRPLRGD